MSPIKQKIAVTELANCSLTGDRRNNQDRCLIVKHTNALLLGIADGMGGHPGGDAAAQVFVDTGAMLMREQDGPIIEPRRFLQELLRLAHQGIQRLGRRNDPSNSPRTTAVVALLQDGMARWVHAGDSRFYLLRNQRTHVRTTDHSQVERLHEQGLIQRSEMLTHPARNLVTRCLGGSGELPKPHYGESSLAAEDRLLLCSDGLWSSIPERRVIDVLCNIDASLASKVVMLAKEAAKRRAPESDNVSLIACRIGLVDSS